MDILKRAFFKCTECGFKFSLLGAQAKYQPEICPCCQGDVDYMTVKEREKYIRELKSELQFIGE